MLLHFQLCCFGFFLAVFFLLNEILQNDQLHAFHDNLRTFLDSTKGELVQWTWKINTAKQTHFFLTCRMTNSNNIHGFSFIYVAIPAPFSTVKSVQHEDYIPQNINSQVSTGKNGYKKYLIIIVVIIMCFLNCTFELTLISRFWIN